MIGKIFKKTQNHALRTAIGCLLMSSQDHLHQESMVMQIRQHSELLTKQFLAGSFLPNNPGHQHLNRQPPRRRMKETLLKHESQVANLYTLPATQDEYKKVLKSIHTASVKKSIEDAAPNRVLQSLPPPSTQLNNPSHGELEQDSPSFAPASVGNLNPTSTEWTRLSRTNAQNVPPPRITPPIFLTAETTKRI